MKKLQIYACVFTLFHLSFGDVDSVDLDVELDIQNWMRPEAEFQERLDKKFESLMNDNSPLARYQRRSNWGDLDEVYELEPMVIRPLKSLPERVDRAMREHKMSFLTAKGIREEYLKELPSWDVNFLNRFTIPLFGISPERRAYQRARHFRMKKHADTVRLFMEVKREFHPEEYEELKKYYNTLFLGY